MKSNMNKPSIKKVSTAEIEAAIAKALAGITGWDECIVSVQNAEFAPETFTTQEVVTLTLKATLKPFDGPDPFAEKE
jgi:hypothetical protein